VLSRVAPRTAVLRCVASDADSFNQLNGLFRAVQQIGLLQTVSFKHNQLTLPANWAALYALPSLYLAFMLPSGILSADFSFNNITLDLLDTTAFALQSNLQHLLLANNRIACYDATILLNLPALIELDLSFNVLGTSLSTPLCPLFTWTVASPLQLARFQGNPAYVSSLPGTTLPSFLAIDASQYVSYNLSQPYSCPAIVATGASLLIQLDPG
jgi:hypothetical protein